MEAKLTTVNQVLELLTYLDEAGVCGGNDDSKFLELAATHKGSFKDVSGKCHDIFLYFMY